LVCRCFKAAQRLPFFTFSNLTRHFPNIGSLENFISSEDYLSSSLLEITGNTTSLSEVSQEVKLKCAIKILRELQPEIEKGKIDYTGTVEFSPKAIKNIFTDKEMNFVLSTNGDAEIGYPMSRPKLDKHFLDLSKEPGYAYKENYGTSEEKKSGERIIYQLFIEPKGEVYADNDQWKEDFLLEIEEKHVIHQNKNFKLIGLPFYNSSADMQSIFSKAFDKFL
jgi:type III restriction enzyme